MHATYAIAGDSTNIDEREKFALRPGGLGRRSALPHPPGASRLSLEAIISFGKKGARGAAPAPPPPKKKSEKNIYIYTYKYIHMHIYMYMLHMQ